MCVDLYLDRLYATVANAGFPTHDNAERDWGRAQL
jgi:hypothetical protein